MILKKYNPDWSFSEMDFSKADFWVQIYGLPLNRQNSINVRKIEGMLGNGLDKDMARSRVGSCCRFVKCGLELMLVDLCLLGFLWLKKIYMFFGIHLNMKSWGVCPMVVASWVMISRIVLMKKLKNYGKRVLLWVFMAIG